MKGKSCNSGPSYLNACHDENVQKGYINAIVSAYWKRITLHLNNNNLNTTSDAF